MSVGAPELASLSTSTKLENWSGLMSGTVRVKVSSSRQVFDEEVAARRIHSPSPSRT